MSIPALWPLVVLQIPGVPDGPSPIGMVLSAILTLLILLAIGYFTWHLWQSIADQVRYDEPDQK